MKIKLFVLFIVFSVSVKSQEFTVFYKEKRKPAKVTSQSPGVDESELEVYSQELNRIKKALRTLKNKDSIAIYDKMYEEQLIKLVMHSKKIKREQGLSIPVYDFVTVLKAGSKKSLYYPQEKVSNDSISESNINEKGKSIVNQRINYNNSEIIYIDQKNNKKVTALKIHEFDLKDREFLIEETLEKQEWILTKETKKIGQYVCYRAELKYSNNTIEAWYTTEIKISAGPKGYYGLPGLILELRKGKSTVRFDSIQLFSNEKIEIQPPTEGEKIIV